MSLSNCQWHYVFLLWHSYVDQHLTVIHDLMGIRIKPGQLQELQSYSPWPHKACSEMCVKSEFYI